MRARARAFFRLSRQTNTLLSPSLSTHTTSLPLLQSFCCDSWCYVNATTCTKEIQDKHSFSVNSSLLNIPGLYYSYGACADDQTYPQNIDYSLPVSEPANISYAHYTKETCPYNGQGLGSGFGAAKGPRFALGTAEMSVQAQVLSTTVMKCQTPEWGKAYASMGLVTVGVQYKDEAFIFCASGNSSTCQLSFRLVVSNISSRNAGNSSVEIVVKGHGFDVRQNYCLTEYICGKLLWISPSEIVFEKPELSSFPHELALSLHEPFGQDIGPEHLLFKFEKYWYKHNVSRAAASGGAPILIEGSGFSPQSQFICRFSRDSAQITSVALVTGSDSNGRHSLTCTTPYWPFAHGKVSLSIHEAIPQDNNTSVFFETVPFVSMKEPEAVFEFEQGIERLIETETTEPTSPRTLNGTRTGPSSGGSSVLIRGYGLDIHAKYLCTFSRVVDAGSEGANKTERISSNATVVSSKCLSCRTPNWGAAFSFGDASVSVTHEDASILSCEDEMASSCLYHFSDIVSRLNPSSGLAAGKEVSITIHGFGFSANVPYELHFDKDGSMQAKSSLINFVSSTSLIFKKPLWSAAAAASVVSLHRSMGQALQSATLMFTFQSHWEHINVSSAPARGGQVMQVTGYGFRPGTINDYQCQFSRGSDAVFSPARSSPEASTGVSITCEIPHWPFSFGPVSFQLNLYPKSRQDDPQFAGPYGDCASYRYGINVGWCLEDNVCETCARSCERECALAGHADTEMIFQHKYGIEWSPPSISCREVRGSCSCATADFRLDLDDEGFSTNIRGIFSDGDGDYESRSHCEWIISATTEISLRFTEFSTESGYDFVTVYRCASANCTDEQQIARLSGQSVSAGTRYTSSTGWMKVVFTSDDLQNGPGFKALVTFADLQSQQIPHDGLNLTSAVVNLQQSTEGIMMPKFGAAQGGNVVRLAAAGLDVSSQSYECLFFRHIDQQWENVSTSAQAISSHSLECLSPAWGVNFTSGNVSIRIRMDGRDIEASTCELTVTKCTYLFMTSWDPRASGPRIISGSYSSILTVRGFGFSAQSKYSCNISVGLSSVEMDAEADVLSTTEILCITTGFWHTSSFIDGVIQIYEMPLAGGPLTSVCSGCCSAKCDGRCHRSECGFDVVNSTGILGLLGVSRGSVVGGSTITVLGFGFDVGQKYAARFTAGQFSVVSEEIVSRSLNTLEFTVPAWTRERQQVTLEVLTETGEGIQHAVEEAAGAVFDNKNVRFYFFSELLSISESLVLDRFGGDSISIEGRGFYNGEYACQLVSNETTSEAGSRPAPSSQDFVPVFAMDETRILCIVSPFDTNTSFEDFQTQQGAVRLYERQENGTWVAVFAKVPARVQIVQINRAPSFVAARLTFTTSARVGDVIVANFAEHVVPGADAFGNEIKTEVAQRVWFGVEIMSGNQLFNKLPVLHPNGTAVFSMIANKYGIVLMRITLYDDGGTDFGGKDSTTQTVAVDIQQSAAVVVEDHPDREAVEVLQVFEVHDSAPRNIVPRFRPRILSSAYFSLFQRTSFSVWTPEISSLYFSKLPIVSVDGSLSFKLHPGAFGFAEFFVNITTEDITTGIAQQSHGTINISIVPLNSVPAFGFNASHVVKINEDQCSAQACEVFDVATNVSASKYKKIGPRGENWPEMGQRLTFVLISHKTEIHGHRGISKLTADLSDLFLGTPIVHSVNGSLVIKTVPHASGRSTLEFVIEDNGGVANGGVNRSDPQKLFVQVDPVNDPPYGLLECGNAQKCAASCSGSFRKNVEEFASGSGIASGSASGSGMGSEDYGSGLANPDLDNDALGCNLTISVILNNQELGRCFPFTFNPFVTVISPSLIGTLDESHQTSIVRLALRSPSDNASEAFLLQARPTLQVSNGTATLSLCASQNTSGKLFYDVLIEDDGGGSSNTFLAGNVVFDIQSSNRAPTFDLCATCADAGDAVQEDKDELGRCCGGTITVQEGSGRVTVAGFASNISAGRVFTMEGVTHEDQNISFSVSILSIFSEEFETSEAAYIFTPSGSPSVLADGTLSFELIEGRYGKVSAAVWISDDGGTAFDGVNVSSKVLFDLYVFSSVASLNITIMGNDLNLESSENLEALRLFIANEFHVPADLMKVTVVRVSGTSPVAVRDKRSSDSGPKHRFSGRRLLEMQTYQVLVELLGWSIATVMEQIERAPDVLLALQAQYGLTLVNLTDTPEVIKASALHSTFDVQESHITLLETSVEQEEVFESFFVNISQTDSRYLRCEASVSCAGSCACPSVSSSTSSGQISDGTGDYLPNSHCSWVIATGSEGLVYPCSDILLHFEHFDSEEKYDTVHVYSCTSQECSSRSEIVTLNGNENTCNSDKEWKDLNGNRCSIYDLDPDSCQQALAYAVDGISAQDKCCACNGGQPNNFALTRQYKSTTGYLQIVFRSDEVEQRTGFVASWSTSEKGGREVIQLRPSGNLAAISFPAVIPICRPLCTTADLSLVTLPFLHGKATFNFTLGDFDTVKRSVTITVMSVNDAPTFSFGASHLQVPEFTNSNDTMQLAVNISKGPSLKSLVRNEDDQNLTFRLDLLDAGGVMGFLANSSWVDPNGVLHLPLFFTGPLKFNLTLLDDGGNVDGGKPSSSQNISLFVFPVNQPPSFALLNKSVNVSEAGESYLSSRPEVISLLIASDIERGPPRPYLGMDEERQTLSFHLTAHDPAMQSLLLKNVSVDPETGYLHLVLEPYQNGKIRFDLVLFDSANFNNASRAEIFEIDVQSVNDPPKFQLIANSFEDIEYQQTVHSMRMRHIPVATDITAGPPLNFEIGNEDYQELSFALVPLNLSESNALFEVPPKVYSNGTMELLLKPYVIGMAMFSLSLGDDGRDGSPHVNVSLPQQFTIHIKAINNEPRFGLTRDRFQELEVKLTTSLLHFQIATNISAGPPFELGVTNEDYQRLSFTVAPLNEMAASNAMFESVQLYRNGTLELILIPYTNGVARYSVSLTDDGGNAFGGRTTSQSANVSIEILAVNNRPFFQVQPLLTVHETADLYLRVVQDFAFLISKGPPIPEGPLPEEWVIGNEVQECQVFMFFAPDTSRRLSNTRGQRVILYD